MGCSAQLGMGTLFVGLVASLAGLAVAAWGYQDMVVRNPGPHLERSHIEAVIAQETPVLFNDGVTPVGVFFTQEHRQTVDFDELPQAYVMGLVAAEDGRFWYHAGINPKGIARAMRDNFAAGTVVAGGSTLTQQTAKNIYYRPDRSAKAKLVELLNALRLEAHYDKAEILEFYANQFHVTGNGRGLGIAARHFFDKDVSELTVLESAFLAGLVKAPAYYDPFLGDEERRQRAVQRAHDRTRYVLGRMLDEPVEHLAGPLPTKGDPASERAYEARLLEAGRVRAEARKLLDDGFELPFKRGAFRYDSSAVLDEVARRLGEPPFAELLASHGVDDPATAGLTVITTLDPTLQAEATYGLWHHLTEVGSWMEAPTAADYLIEGHRGPRFDPDHPPEAHSFRVAKVLEQVDDGGLHLRLDLGGHECLADRDAMVRVAVAAKRGAKGNKTVKASSEEVDAFVKALPVDSVVLVSVREEARGDRLARCDLEMRPELQGASMVLQDGRIRAMVGGNDNRNFNRATALRQYGSTWKPLVFHAALQLGWSPADDLDNRRNIFPFSTTFYAPRPDHTPDPVVSMSWAGVNSENLASVWLLYHLTDRLDGEQVRALAHSLDLARRPDESATDYRTRIQKAGVLPTPNRVTEALFLQARSELLAGQLAHEADRLGLRSLLYGWGYAAERSRVARESASTRAWKEHALDNNWLTMRSRLDVCAPQHDVLVAALEEGVAPALDLVPDLSVLLDGERVEVACGALPEGYVVPDEAFVASLPLTRRIRTPWGRPDPVVPDPVDSEPEPEPAPRRWPWQRDRDEAEPTEQGDDTTEGPERPRRGGLVVADFDDVLVDDRLHVATLRALDSALERRRLSLDIDGMPDLYDPELLYWHQDFRVLLSLRYLTSLAEQYGVQTELQPVLSLPLGASEITLEEAVSVYQGLVTGDAYEVVGSSLGQPVPAIETPGALIEEIRDVDGRVIYRAEPEPTRVADPLIGEMTADILRNVVEHGTGRRALHAVPLGNAQVPVGGKTGTTNDFKNAAFLGFVPVATDDGFTARGGYVVGAYVGYDDNREMRNGSIRLAGASGALPAWIGAAQGIVTSGLAGEGSGQPVDGAWPLVTSEGLARVVAGDSGRVGLSPAEVRQGPSVLVRQARVEPEPEVRFEPIQRPPRMAPRTEEALVEQPPSARRRPFRVRPR
jgi:membrane peptidoglycan carboxypeptidase